MFERFTDKARQVVVAAQAAARELNHAHVGPEHLLLGLLQDANGLASQVLAPLGIDHARVRGRVVELVGAGEGLAHGHVPFTPRAKKVLELSLRECLSLHHRDIEPGHIFLGLLRIEDGLAARILSDFSAPPAELRERTLQKLGLAGTSGISVAIDRDTSVAAPDHQLRALLLAAGKQARLQGREECRLQDLLEAAVRLPELRPLLQRALSELRATDAGNPPESE